MIEFIEIITGEVIRMSIFSFPDKKVEVLIQPPIYQGFTIS